MKNFLVLPIVLMSFYVIADERVILGSIERERLEDSYSDAESTLNGFGARFYSFIDDGFYLGASFASRSADNEECFQTRCFSSNVTETMLSGEIGRDLGSWYPFIGVNFTAASVDSDFFSSSHGSVGLNAGLWLELDKFKIRGVINDINNNENRSVFGGVLFQMDNKFVLGAEIGTLLDSEVDTLRLSLQFGISF